MKADFQIVSGELSLADWRKQFPFVVVSGDGQSRNLQSQHRALETAALRAAKFSEDTGRSVTVVDRRSGEVWSEAWCKGYNR